MLSISERNPFAGPRSIPSEEALRGRAAQIRGLCNSLLARRIVPLHSPSGAGKSWLSNADLIAKLKDEEFDVWHDASAA